MSDVNWRLAMRSLKRDLRAADVRALFVALVLAVAASTMIAFFLDRLERGLERQAGQMLGAIWYWNSVSRFLLSCASALRMRALYLAIKWIWCR
ncbi:hypothetical protein HSBAA_43130 [Vreelandella sulfidaeris]|uniref:Uncharacterized protein n=1 Tax=Vreelandella sulfidaeris TaxID=115553 RepID=A0A455UBN7_9GAMM|nr:hypothetical protein HSBAA_43130 [Halomonas sulfidaeris]